MHTLLIPLFLTLLPSAVGWIVGRDAPRVEDAHARDLMLVGNSSSSGPFTCNTTWCMAASAKLKVSGSSALILLVGSSLESNALKDVCAIGNANVVHLPWAIPIGQFAPLPIQTFRHCTLASGDTLAQVFIPGSVDPSHVPYYKLYTGSQTTTEILRMSKDYILANFGREPTAVVVDSTLWDITAWWQLWGMPPPPYATPGYAPVIQQWIDNDIPLLMKTVESVYPKSFIAFRTQPPVLVDSLGQNNQIINSMASKVREATGARLFMGRYTLVDWNLMVNSMAGPLAPAYIDDIHPGPHLSFQYVSRVISWVRAVESGGVSANASVGFPKSASFLRGRSTYAAHLF